MFNRGRKVVNQVKSMFDKPSTSVKHSRHLLLLGKIEETDLLGTALHKEATIGNSKTLKKVLITDICVDYPNDLGQTPLFCACARNNESTALLLLQWRANPNERSLDGMTSCHAASYMGNVMLLGKLIEGGGDLRLHDNKGNNVRDWATQNWDPRTRSKMLEFIDKIYIYAMSYRGNAFSSDMATNYYGRPPKQTSVMEIMMMKTGSDLKFDNLERVQSTGFGKVYQGNDRDGGIISVVPLISETTLLATDGQKYDTGFYSYIERMQWLNETVSVKQVKPDVGIQDGIDLLIADAEFLGKLRHPNILLLMSISQSVYLDRMMLVFEYVENATLYSLLHKTTKSLSQQDCLAIMQQVCAAMCFIHNQNLIHCGLSSMAVYLVSPHRAKVGNFEFMVESIKADLGKPSHVSTVSHGEFLYNWMSPELIQGLAPHYSSDVYSFCCIMWEIFARQVPWTHLRPKQIRKKVVDDKTQLNIDFPKMPVKLKSILGYGLELREEYRLNKFEYINEWLKTNQQPKFQRTNSAQDLGNKSGNFADQLYTCASASWCSSESHFNCPETWDQDQLDFSREGSHLDSNSFNDVITSSPNSSFDEIDGANPVSLCSNYESSSQGAVLAHKLSERFHLSPSVVTAAHSGHSRKSLRNRKYPSESDLEHQPQPFPYLQPIKPASHLRCLNPGDPLPIGNDGFHLLERNNNGRRSSWDKDVTESREYSSQSHLGNTDERSYMVRSSENVRRLADLYQLRFNQHKLRQAILKGSMAPRGSCQDLETSSDSVCGKSAYNRKTVGDKFHSSRADRKILSVKKFVMELGFHSPVETADHTCGTCHLKSSTPKDRLLSTEVDEQPVSMSTDFQKICYTLKVTSDACPSCGSKGWKLKDSERQAWSVGDGVRYCHGNTTDADAKIKTKEDLECVHGETGNNEDNSDTHGMFLQEIRTVHQKLVSKSFGRDITDSSFGVCYNSPHIETYSPDVRRKEYQLLSQSRCPDIDDSQGEIGKALTFSSPNYRSQSIVSSPSKVKIRDLSQVLPGRAHVEDNSFRIDNYDNHKSETTNYEMKKKAVNFYLDKSDFEENERSVPGIDEVSQSWAHNGKVRNSGFIYPADDHYNNHQEHINPRTSLGVGPAFSLPKAQNKRSADRVDAELNLCNMKDVLNGTFTVSREDETTDMVSSLVMDSGACSMQNTSVDSDRIGQWVDCELDKIKDKMRLRSSKLVSDHGTESSSSFHGLQDISPVSTLGGDEETAITISDIYALGSPDNADLGMNVCSQQNNGGFQITESAKTSVEVDGSCDFEFHEFYIDDDLDSAERIQQGIFCSKMSNLDSNTSTRHAADASDVTTAVSGSVKQKAEYFLHVMTNVKPPVFPRKLKRLVNISQENSTLENSTFSVEEMEQLENNKAQRNVIDKDTFQNENELVFSSKGAQASRDGNVLVKSNAVTSTVSLQNGNDPSFSLRAGDRQETGDIKLGEDTVLSGDFHECAAAIKKDLKDDTCQESLSDAHQLTSQSEACRVNKTEELFISVDKTKSYTHSTDESQKCTRGNNYKRGVNDGSDSDSDHWLRSKVITIQEKIRRRRARLTYSVSSDENSDNDDNKCQRPLAGSKGSSNGEEIFTKDFDNATNCQAEGSADSLNPESIKNPLDSGDEVAVINYSKYKSRIQQKMPEHHDFVPDKLSLLESQERSLATTSYLNKKGYNGSRPKISSYLGRTHNSNSFASTSLKDNCEETIAAKKCQPKDMESSSLKDFNSLAFSSKQNKSSSKTSPVMSVPCADTSMSNKESKSSCEHVSQSGVSLNKWIRCERVSQSGVSLNKWIPWRSQKKKNKEPSLNGCNVLPEECKKKGHRSILRRPSIFTTETKVKDVSSLIPSPVQPSKSKFSVGHDSKLSDKVISFQGIAECENDKSNLKKVPVSSQNDIPFNERRSQREESFDSYESDNKIVKTWLERENFAELGSLASSRQADHQSITSRVLEVQTMSTKLQVPHKPSISMLGLQAENTPRQQSKSSLTAKKSPSQKQETESKHHSSPFWSNESLSPICMDSTCIRPENAKEKSAEFSYTQDDQVFRANTCQSLSKPAGQKSSLDQHRFSRGTLPVNQNIDHCLTLDLRTPRSEHRKEKPDSLTDCKKQSHIGFHRFYIPREMYHEGCTVRMNIQTSPNHPTATRIITTTTDPVSGLTETLLDQAVFTHKLRSTMQIE